MRGILITTLSSTDIHCPVCHGSPGIEIHASQGEFWWVPEPHDAPCGQPCIGGGLEPPFRGHRGHGNCDHPGCKVVGAPVMSKHRVKGQLPPWMFKALLPILVSSKQP